MPSGMDNRHFWTTDPGGEALTPKGEWLPPEDVAFVAVASAYEPKPAGCVPFYRFTNANGQSHFWTQSPTGEALDSTFHREDPPAFYVFSNQVAGTVPLRRFADNSGHHFWNIGDREQYLPDTFVEEEGPAGYVYPRGATGPGLIPVYRFYRYGNDRPFVKLNRGRVYRLSGGEQFKVERFWAIPFGSELIAIQCAGQNAIYYKTEGNPPGLGDKDDGTVQPMNTAEFKIISIAGSMPDVYLDAKYGKTTVAVYFGPADLGRLNYSQLLELFQKLGG